VPAIAMLGATPDALRARAEALRAACGDVPGLTLGVAPTASAVGGGAMPLAELPSWALTIAGHDPDAVDAALRAASPPVVGRVADGRVVLDLRTIAPSDEPDVVAAVLRSAPGR
jgi:L-seryl-tRNA(Ser) seleniumtransferase